MTIHRAVGALMAPRACQLGAVYATLDRMEDKVLVHSWLSEPTAQRGGRARRHYKLSMQGEEALKEAVDTARRIYDAVERKWGGGPWSLA